MRKLLFLLLFAFALPAFAQFPLMPGVLDPPVGVTGACGTVTRFSVAASTGTSANVSTVTLGTGDQVFVSASEGSGGSGYEHISSVTGQTGYIIPFWGWSYAGSGFAGGGTSWYYIPSASGISGATLTVNFNVSITSPRIFVLDIPNASGTASIDAISMYSLGDNTNTSLTQAPITTSGTKDCVIGFAAFSNSVSSPWSTNFTDLGGSTQGASSTTWLSNITSSPSTPVWANSNGNGMGAVGEFALGYNVTASLPYCLMDSSGGTNTVLPTVATVAASTFGCSVGPGSGGGASNFTFTVNDNSTSLTYATAAHHALLNPAWRFLYSGATYSDSNTLGVAIATVNSSQSTSIQMTLPGNLNSNFFYLINPTVTQSVDFYTTVLGSDNLGPVHIFTEGTPSGDGPNIAVQTTGGNLEFLCEPGGSGNCLNGLNAGTAAPLVISSSTWYKLNMQVNGGLTSQSPTSPAALIIGSNTITLPSGCAYNPNAPWYISGTGTGEFALPTSPCSGGVVTVTLVGVHAAGYTMLPATVETILSDTGTTLATFYNSEASQPYYVKYGLVPTGAVPASRVMYFDKWAICYAELNGAVCPATVVP